jgi:putative hemolysin
LDESALTVALLAGASLTTGLAADAALHDYSHSKLEKLLEGDDRLERVTARLKNFDDITQSVWLFCALMALLLFGAVDVLAGGLGPALREHPVRVALGAVLGFVFLALVRGVASRLAELMLLRLLWFVRAVAAVMTPIAVPLRAVCNLAARSLGAKEEATEAEDAVEDILDAVAEGEAGGVLHEEAADLIENIIDFNALIAKQIMTPRTAMVCVRKGMPLDEVVALFNTSGHYYLPMYEENRDNIFGMLAMPRVLASYEALRSGELTLESLVEPAVFVPETKQVSDLLRELKSSKRRIALVLDEFGGTIGLVTLDDVVDEIVGELGGEYSKHIHKHDERIVEIDAKMPIDYLNERFNISLPEGGDYETVGGFLAASLGKVPAKGENFNYDGVSFEVTDADERKVKRVKVTAQAAAD